MDRDPELLQKSDPAKRETLVTENPVDEMDAEQTFPSPEELQEAERENRTIKKKVPRGTSEYQVGLPDIVSWLIANNICTIGNVTEFLVIQAAWILDDDDDESGSEDDDEDMEEDSDADEFADSHEFLGARNVSESSEDEEEVEWLDTQSDAMSVAPDGAYDKNMDLKEDLEM